ncbi:SurA N-terminal domain-containing protein [Patescibacteria group bacterium]|nr:SurA N-terminal domain-containing protein [Patescibacteria group bacterium]
MAEKKTTDKDNKSFVTKRNVIIVLVLFVIVALSFFLKKQLIVASVNGQPIYRLTLISELEKQGGKKVLDGLVNNALILQEAKKRNITISDAEINLELKKIEDNLKKQGQTLDQALTLQGVTLQSVKKNIELNLIMRKLLEGKTSVSEKEVSDYIEKNKKSIPEDAKPEDTKNMVRQQLEQQKFQEKGQELIKSLQDKAKINYYLSL